MIPLGIRNNNPGNILANPNNRWVGKIRSKGRFEAFDTPTNGLRALMVLLCNYYRKAGLKTVQQIVNVYAPPCENDTNAYAEFVAEKLNIPLDGVVIVSHKPNLIKFVKAIVRFENGVPTEGFPEFWYDDAVYEEAANRALKKCNLSEEA